jgi:hypothetical protein
LTGESGTKINDVGIGCSENGYDLRTSESVTLYAGMTYTALVSTQYSAGEELAIWIDFNDNFVFESSERVALQTLTSTLNTPTAVTIPAIGSEARVGNHRMRAALAYNAIPDSCTSSYTYGETLDYKVNIIAYTRKLDVF